MQVTSQLVGLYVALGWTIVQCHFPFGYSDHSIKCGLRGPPPSIPRYVLRSAVVGELDQQLIDRDEVLALLKSHLEDAQSCMKAHYDRGHWEVSFVEDMV